MFEFLASGLGGGLTGLLGAGLSFASEIYREKQRAKQELALRELELKILNQEAASVERVAAIDAENAADQREHDLRIAEVEAENESEQRAHDLREASYQAATKRISKPGDSGWVIAVDVVRGFIRPLLTLLLLGLSAWIYFELDGQPISEEQAMIISSVLYLTGTAVLWWFGERALAKGRDAFKVAPR